MENRLYLTAEEGKTFSFPYDWKQTFDHPFEMSRSINEALTVKTYVAEDADRQIGLEILKLLLDFTFATRDQLERLLVTKGISDVSRLEVLLPKYLERRLINRFTLSVYPMESIPEDAFVVYCLDHSARHILNHFYRDDVGATWKSTNAYRSSELVSKYLSTNEFYLSLLHSKKDDLSFFEPAANFTIRNRDIRMSGMFRIMKGATPVDFVLEVIRSRDLPTAWRHKVDSQIYPFITDRFWNRYFRMEPTFIFLAENLAQAEETAALFYDLTKSSRFRITTDEELVKGIENATFYKYEPDESNGQVVSGKLVPVVSSLFKPAAS